MPLSQCDFCGLNEKNKEDVSILQYHISFCFDKIYKNLLNDMDNHITEICEKNLQEKEKLEETIKLLMKKNISLYELCQKCIEYDISNEF